MSGRHDRRRDVAQAIRADEIGLEYGVYGAYRLRSACQPIYAPKDGNLVPVAVEALIQPQRAGAIVPPQAFYGEVSGDDRLFVESLSRTLHVRNYPYVGLDGVDLFFNYDPLVNDHLGRALAEIRLMAQHLGQYDLDASMLVCEITEQAAPDDGVLLATVREMRRNGFRIAIDDFGAGHSTEARIRLLEPDIVKIDGAWFSELCRHAAAEKLFRPLLSLLHDQGAKVLVEGIEQPAQLHVALDAGADLLQGFLLARPALTGTLLSAEPLGIEALVKPTAKIIPLFG
jgi:EAL domain-containing protein (putative c-di-GMP-specific phosphodiesterase class I)